MFTEQLTNLTIRSKSPNYKIPRQTVYQPFHDLHYQICHAFFKKTGEKLIQKQAEIIDESCRVIGKLFQNFKGSKRQSFQSSTDDSQYTPDEDYSLESEERLIARKSIKRRSENHMQQAMKQLEQNCSVNTVSVINSVVSEFSKLQSKLRGIEAKYHMLLKKQEAADKYHQQNMILRKKLSSQQAKTTHLLEELNLLKTKNQNISKCVEEKVNAIAMNQKIVDINQKVYRDIKSFLQDKQVHVTSRLRKIQHIQESIMVKIQSILSEPSQQSNSTNPQSEGQYPCERCCAILKKLKQSILKYRSYLQHEAEQVEKLYSKHKKSLFAYSSKGGGSNKSLG